MRTLALLLFLATSALAQPRYVLAPPAGSADRTAIAATADAIMVVWCDDGRITYRLFDSTGAPTSDATSLMTEGKPRVAVAANREMFLIVWSDDREVVRGLRVMADEQRLDAAPFTIATNAVASAVASDGYAFLVGMVRYTSATRFIFLTRTDVVVVPVSRDATTESEWIAGSTGETSSMRLNWTGSRYALAWSGGNANQADAYVRFVARNGVPLDPTVRIFSTGRLGGPSANISSVAGDDRELVIFTAGNGYGNGSPDVNRFILLPDGTVVRGEPLPDTFWYATFGGREYVVAKAPVVPLTWPFVAIADRDAVHVVSVMRRRTMSAR